MKKIKQIAVILAVLFFAAALFTACKTDPDLPAVAYTVTYDSQSATEAADPTSQNVTSPATTVVTLPTAPTKDEYIFDGWYTAIDGGGTEFTGTTVVTADITVYAKWTPAYLTLTGIFVSKTGSDSNAGTIAAPYLTIAKAITESTDEDSIHVAAGTYAEAVVVSLRLSILGGYNANFTAREYETVADRENVTYKTVIQGPATTGGTTSDPMSSLEYRQPFKTVHIIEGLVINAPEGATGGAVAAIKFINDAQPTLKNCTITGSPNTTATYSYGIHVTGSSPSIDNNSIKGGKSSDDTYAIMLTSSSGINTEFSITNNTINSGDSGSGNPGTFEAYGIYIKQQANNASKVSNNTISLGTSVKYGRYLYLANCGIEVSGNTLTGGSATDGSNGITVSSSVSGMIIKNNTLDMNSGGSIRAISVTNPLDATIYNNTIKLYGHADGFKITGLYFSSSSAKVYNNTIVATGITGGSNDITGIVLNSSDPYCVNNIISVSGDFDGIVSVEIFGDAPDPTRINHNAFYTDGTDTSTEDYFKTPTNNNITNNPQLDASMKLQLSSPTAAKSGGVDESATFTTDKDGVTRAPWGMGAYFYVPVAD